MTSSSRRASSEAKSGAFKMEMGYLPTDKMKDGLACGFQPGMGGTDDHGNGTKAALNQGGEGSFASRILPG
jgi:hypothetical protein